MTNFIIKCRICGELGHPAKICPCAGIEARKDPKGELDARRSFRDQERARIARKQAYMNLGGAQSSKGFGL